MMKCSAEVQNGRINRRPPQQHFLGHLNIYRPLVEYVTPW